MRELLRPLFNILSYVETRVSMFLWHFFYLWSKELSIEACEGPSLIIAPHPDDETLGCGATVARLRQAGKPVRIVFVTDGRASTRSVIITPEELVNIRCEEAKNACKVLGVDADHVEFLCFIDGEADKKIDEIRDLLCQRIGSFAPQRIFSPYDLDRHPDHRAVAEAINTLWKTGAINCPVYEYPLWFWPRVALWHLLRPRRLLRLRRVDARGVLPVKREAMNAHRSQHQNLTGEPGWRKLRPYFLDRFFTPYELYFEKGPAAEEACSAIARVNKSAMSKGFCQIVRADFQALKLSRQGLAILLAYLVVCPGFLAVFLFRASSFFARKGRAGWVVGKLIARLNAFVNGCEIHPRASIGPGLFLPHPAGIVIGLPRIGANATILQNVTIGGRYRYDDPLDPNNYPVIGDDVVINAGAVVLGGIELGKGVQVGANAVVTQNVPDNATAVGVPARVIPSRENRSSCQT